MIIRNHHFPRISGCSLLCQRSESAAPFRLFHQCRNLQHLTIDSPVSLAIFIAAQVHIRIVSMTLSTSCPSSTEVTSLVSHTATYHAQHQDTLIGAFSSTVHGSENNFLPCFIEIECCLVDSSFVGIRSVDLTMYQAFS